MIEEKYYTNCDRVNNPIAITPEYIIVHSTGCGYTSKDSLWTAHNKPGANAEHGLVDDSGSYITLPFNLRGSHVGSKGNMISVGFEICEPKNIAYKDVAHTSVDTAKYNPDDINIQNDFTCRYNNGVELCAYIMQKTGIGIDKVLSHAEAYKKGIASNHADVGHWFPLFGKNMDSFRSDVLSFISGGKKTYYCVQVGAFTNKTYAETLAAELQGLGYSTYITVKER